jgi:hypothetical protein
MDGYEFIASLVGSLAWPIAIFAIACVFHRQFRSLATRIQELTFPGGTAKFSHELDKARDAAEEITAAPDDVKGPTKVVPGDPFLELAEKLPEAAVVQAYNTVLDVVHKHRHDLPNPPSPFTPRSVVELLRQLGAIDKQTMHLFKQVAATRNAAVHSRGITSGEAIEFRELCDWLIEQLREGFKKAKVMRDRKA